MHCQVEFVGPVWQCEVTICRYVVQGIDMIADNFLSTAKESASTYGADLSKLSAEAFVLEPFRDSSKKRMNTFPRSLVFENLGDLARAGLVPVRS